jgi:murein DD-endopeptidase MepM/ murein hydrolase activator NlpD
MSGRESAVKTLSALLGAALLATLVWMAAGQDPAPTMQVRQPTETWPPLRSRTTAVAGPGEPAKPLAPVTSSEPSVPAEVSAPIATAIEMTPPTNATSDVTPPMREPGTPRPLIVPVAGVSRTAVRDGFNEMRGNRLHEAIDIPAPRGTPVIAADDGVVKKLFTSVPGGLTVYEFDPDQRYCYYYAHLDRYAAGLHEGQALRRGEVLGYVGTSGNAPVNAPHLHFALIRLDPERRWWKGTYVNPYPLLAQTPD